MDGWFNAEKQVKISKGAKKLSNAWRTPKPCFLWRSLPRPAQSKQSLTWRLNWRQRSLNLSQGRLCSARHIWDPNTVQLQILSLCWFLHMFLIVSQVDFSFRSVAHRNVRDMFLGCWNVQSGRRCWKPSRASSMPRNYRPIQIGWFPAKINHLFGIFYDPWSGNDEYWWICSVFLYAYPKKESCLILVLGCSPGERPHPHRLTFGLHSDERNILSPLKSKRKRNAEDTNSQVTGVRTTVPKETVEIHDIWNTETQKSTSLYVVFCGSTVFLDQHCCLEASIQWLPVRKSWCVARSKGSRFIVSEMTMNGWPGNPIFIRANCKLEICSSALLIVGEFGRQEV